MMKKIIGNKGKWTIKGTGQQYLADSLIHNTTCHTQNHSFNIFEWKGGRMDKLKPICSPLFQSWGIKIYVSAIFYKRNPYMKFQDDI